MWSKAKAPRTLVYTRATTDASAARSSTVAPICGVPRASRTTPLTVAGNGAAEAGKRPTATTTIRAAIWQYLLRTQFATHSNAVQETSSTFAEVPCPCAGHTGTLQSLTDG